MSVVTLAVILLVITGKSSPAGGSTSSRKGDTNAAYEAVTSSPAQHDHPEGLAWRRSEESKRGAG